MNWRTAVIQFIRTKILSILPLYLSISPYCTEVGRIGEHTIPFTFDIWLNIHDLLLSSIKLNKNTGNSIAVAKEQFFSKSLILALREMELCV